jgi:serine phosphatase RsbU (regulator of sigma subunit)
MKLNLGSNNVIRRNNINKLEGLIDEYTHLKLLLKEEQVKYRTVKQQLESIHESLDYAKNIQYAMLPDEAVLSKYFHSYFTFFHPLSEVSGDFFWYHENQNGLYVICADCTGHGIPGAFLSMLGMNIITAILNEAKLSDPGEILAEIHNNLCRALNQSNKKNSDSIDISICRYDQVKKRVEFAGAKSDLIFFENGKAHRLKGNRYSAGGMCELKYKTFDTHGISAEEGRTFYLSTDGIRDQFGGPMNQKLKVTGYQSILESIQDCTMQEQFQLVQLYLDQWMINTEQVDDMLLIGFRI